MELIDTHAHLTAPEFSNDLDAVLARARANGVRCIVAVSETVAECHAALALVAAHGPLVAAAAGLHPAHVAVLSDAAAEEAACSSVEGIVSAGRVVALGEVGLDFTPRVVGQGVGDVRARQRRVFKRLLRAAAAAGIPATVHSRGAGRHALEIVAEVPEAVVCMHAFDGRPVYAERAIARAKPGTLLFSVPPSIARDEGAQKLVRRLPLAALALESDAPALPPVRGERNEPGNIAATVGVIAALKDLPVGDVAAALLENTRRCFKKLGQGHDVADQSEKT